MGPVFFAPGGNILYGHVDMDRFVLGYLAAFPDPTFTVDNLIVNRDPGLPTRLAMRWHIEATHSGWGGFGAPSGAPVLYYGPDPCLHRQRQVDHGVDFSSTKCLSGSRSSPMPGMGQVLPNGNPAKTGGTSAGTFVAC